MKTAGDPLSHRLNARNAKKIALLLVLGFTIYHGMLHLSYRIDSCKWLLSDGRFQGYHVWQPYGCMLHNYSRTDARMCMRYIAYWGGHNTLVFMGDSRIRQIFHAFTKHVSTKSEPVPASYSAHEDLKYTEPDISLDIQFLWRPTLNSSVSHAYQKWLEMSPKERPKIVVTGCATWSIQENNGSLESLRDYKTNLTRLIYDIDLLGSHGSEILWALQNPVDPEKLSPERSMITNEQIDLYNKAALDVLRYSTSRGVHVWSSSRLLSQGTKDGHNAEWQDGLHMGSLTLQYSVQILLNMYCNDQMNFNDGSCCSNQESVTIIQILTFAFFGVMLSLSVGMFIHQRFFLRKYHDFTLLVNSDDGMTTNGNDIQMTPMRGSSYSLLEDSPTSNHSHNQIYTSEKPKTYRELFGCLSKLGLIMAYAFVCDRTTFFMKENKYFTPPNFFLPIAYVFALGLFFTEESKNSRILNRDQTDEWKGWMQMIILVYHMTGASQILPIYVNVQLLISCYLFLTGFGHFSYFWSKGDQGFRRLWELGPRYFPIYWQNKDSSLRRMCEVLFRLNLMVVFLCLTMNRPYQFYFFAPLVTFWFLVLHFTLVMIPQISTSSVDSSPVHYLYMVIKFVLLLSVVTILYMSEVLFEKIFLTRPWKALFVTTDDSIKEWWFRWKIDRYSVPAGMVCAFLYEVLKKHKIIDDSHRGNLFSRGITFLASILSIIGIGMFVSFSFLCRNMSECNEIHPYVSFVPIVSFIVLRNASGWLRTRYSSFFAWFGKISLELFILQYHTWLAADTHGVLVLVPSYPVLNVLVTLFIFVSASHEVHSLTTKLTRYAISSDWRYMTRNIVIFLFIIIPIGIKDGMF